MQPIPYGRQNITDSDIKAVVETLRSEYLTQGPKIKEFEDAFANYVGAKHAVAVANGTAALHLCALALDVRPGQKVITTAITFAASANCVRYCGGEVVFADIDPKTYLLDITSVRKILEGSPKGTYSGIVAVDFAGRAVNLEAFRKLADEYSLWIVEDACHAPGGYFTDSNGISQRCGNGAFAELAIFSLHPVKHIAAGEGGLVTTNDDNLFRKLLLLRSHGITREQEFFTNEPEFAAGQKVANGGYPSWYMEMQLLGYNYRLTDFQAALGLSQLQRASDGLKRRHEIAARYNDAFKGIRQIKVQSAVVLAHAYHLYVIEVENRLGLYNYLRKHGIFCQIHYVPTHLMPYYRQFGWRQGDLPAAEEYYKHCISLPMFPTLTREEQGHVINMIIKFYEGK